VQTEIVTLLEEQRLLLGQLQVREVQVASDPPLLRVVS